MSGWIKLHRSLKSSAVSNHPEYLAVWVHLMLRAQHQASTCVMGRAVIKLDAGQLIFGRVKFSAEIGVSENKVRAALDVLKSLEMITIKNMTKFSIISITNWNEYQLDSPANNHETASKPPADSQQTATYKNDKNVKNEENKDLLEQDKPAKKSKAVEPELDYSVWPQEPDQQILKDWIAMRKAKKGSFSQTVINGFGEEFRKAITFGYSVNDCLKTAIMSNWTGFKFSWLQNQESRGGGNAGYKSNYGSGSNSGGLAHDDTRWADELFGPKSPAIDRSDQQSFQVIEGNFSSMGSSDQGS